MKDKNILNTIKYAILIFFIICLPFTLGLPNESQENLIVLNIAVDKVENEYEVSFEYLIPQYGTSFSEKTGIISDKAKNVATAIEKIEMKTGKTAICVQFASQKICMVYYQISIEKNFHLSNTQENLRQ